MPPHALHARVQPPSLRSDQTPLFVRYWYCGLRPAPQETLANENWFHEVVFHETVGEGVVAVTGVVREVTVYW